MFKMLRIPKFLLQIDLITGVLWLGGKLIIAVIGRIPFIGKFIVMPLNFVMKFIEPVCICALIITAIFLIIGLIKRFMSKRSAKEATETIQYQQTPAQYQQAPVQPPSIQPPSIGGSFVSALKRLKKF